MRGGVWWRGGASVVRGGGGVRRWIRFNRRNHFQANIAFIDEWVGKIFDALERTGQLERTLMVWTADHGDGQADHFHWRK